MKMQLKKFTDEAIINCLHQIVMCRIDTVRPIAFKVGTNSNVLDIGDTVEEDMTEFISNVVSSDFTIDGDATVLCYEKDVDGVLSFNEAQNDSGLTVMNLGCAEVLHTFSTTKVVIYFRKAAGKFSKDENREFLEEQGFDVSDFVFINSRHCPVTGFKWKVVAEDYASKTYDIDVTCTGSLTPDEVLAESLKILKTDVAELGN